MHYRLNTIATVTVPDNAPPLSPELLEALERVVAAAQAQVIRATFDAMIFGTGYKAPTS